MKYFVAIFLSLIITFNVFGGEITEAYPSFSWDRVPVALHFSNGDRDFTDEQVEFIARFPLICIEKNQAIKQHGAMEYGTLAAAKAIKKINPDTKVLFYFNSCIDFGSMYTHGNILSDNANSHWAIKDLKGDYVLVRNKPTLRIYDYSLLEMREWWLGVVKKWTLLPEIDGVFIDALPKYAASPEAKKRDWGEQKYQDIYDGLHLTLSTLKSDYKGEKLIIANYLRGNQKQMKDMGTHFHDYTDGAMMEHFAGMSGSSKEHIAKDIALIKDAAQKRKVVIVKAWPRYNFTDTDKLKAMSQQEKEQMAREDITFPLACFLVGAGEYSYFCYSWGYRDTDGGMINYSEYDKPLGKPLADAMQKEWVYTREFEHASVWVDLENREARITWK